MRAVAWAKRRRLPSRAWLIWGGILSLLPMATASMFGLAIAEGGTEGDSTAMNAVIVAIFAAMTIVPVIVTRMIGNREKKIRVEEQLDVVMDGVSKVHKLLTEDAPAAVPTLTVIPGGRK